MAARTFDEAMAHDVEVRASKRAKKCEEDKIPVTILSGFLGAGKTTLLKHLLENRQGCRVGVLVNDLASINIDAKLVAASSSSSSSSSFVELENGCACCSVSEELLQSLSEMVTKKKGGNDKASQFDHICIETTGVAEPKQLRSVFQEAAQLELPVMDLCELHTMVTIVDASTFAEHLGTSDKISSHPELGGSSSEPDEGESKSAAGGGKRFGSGDLPTRTIADLLTEQVECADVVVINKVDQLDGDVRALSALTATLTALNPGASVKATQWGRLLPRDILGVAPGDTRVALRRDRNDHDEAVANAEVVSHHHHHRHHHDHEHDHGGGASPCSPGCQHRSSSEPLNNRPQQLFGIESFVYCRRRPFHPGRLSNLLETMPVRSNTALSAIVGHDREGEGAPKSANATTGVMSTLIRSKGFTWLASRHLDMLYWSHSGSHHALEVHAPWWATLPLELWPESEEAKAKIASDFENGFGDRRQELVLIGINTDRAAIVSALDACLVDDDELRQYREHWCAKHADVVALQGGVIVTQRQADVFSHLVQSTKK